MARLLSTAEVARRAGVTAKTVARWVDAGVLEALYTSGGHRRVSEEHLASFLETRRSLFSMGRQGQPSVVVVGTGRVTLARALGNAAMRLGGDVRVRVAATPFELGLAIGREAPGLVVLDELGFSGHVPELVGMIRREGPKGVRVVVLTDRPGAVWAPGASPDAVVPLSDPRAPSMALDVLRR